LRFPSLQRSPAQRSRSPGFPSPARCVFRVRSSLDALLPFEPPSHFGPGRSWDSPFRAFLLPASGLSFRTTETLLALPLARCRHASSVEHRIHASSRFMTPRECLDQPPSGHYPLKSRSSGPPVKVEPRIRCPPGFQPP
jgi:hypothetical protein